MRTLKILIIVMGVLIIIGAATVVVTIVRRVAVPSGAGRDVSVSLPAGSQIEAIYGTAGGLVLDLGAEGRDSRANRRLMVIDPPSGAVLRTITVRPAAP